MEADETGTVTSLQTALGALLLYADNGLFRYDGDHVTRVEGEDTSYFVSIHEIPNGLLLGTHNGLFRYDGERVARVAGGDTGTVNSFHDVTGGLLLGADNGLFRYDGVRVVKVEGGDTGAINSFHDVPGGLLLGTHNGLFRYDGVHVARVAGEDSGSVRPFYEAPDGLLLGARNGLFRYDGAHVASVEGGEIGQVSFFHDAANGLLVDAENGLFRYSGGRVARVAGENPGYFVFFYDTPSELLLGTHNGVFRYDGARVTRVEGDETGFVSSFHDSPGGLLVGAHNGLFRYNGARLARVEGETAGWVYSFHDMPDELLLDAENGLFRYDGTRVVRVRGGDIGTIYFFHDTPSGLLLGTDSGLVRAIYQPLAKAEITLDNRSDLKGTAPSKLGIPLYWTITHPCAAIANEFSLFVVETNSAGKDLARTPAIDFKSTGGTTSFKAIMPVPDAGDWTFRVISMTAGATTDIGKPSDPIAFTEPGVIGFVAIWWPTIVANGVVFLLVLNLLVLAAARYWAGAWRFATDDVWGKSVLGPQMLLLRHWQWAQLWLLDLYVGERCKALPGNPQPFLPLPIIGPDGAIADSDVVRARLSSTRHFWVQGSTGMGKTALFRHLIQTHFGAVKTSAFAIFRHDRYILVPVEARRFAEASFDAKGSSAWVVACVLSVLSEEGLSFEDPGLLRAMLRKGTLAIAIDGLNEVARGPAVAAFAAEFPEAPLFVTSQELGEPPFETWLLPHSIGEHIDGLLALYLGQQKGEALGERLRETGLIQHLRSGYDVRLIIQLAEVDPGGVSLPRNRIGLYRAVVAAAWPAGDDRLHLLQAAAWKLISERGPNEDKRRLKSEEDAPSDLLEALANVQARSGRSVRLIRPAPPGYEFVHDQMNAYLAACWFVDRPTMSVMRDLLVASKAWQEGLEAQRTLWNFVAVLLDRHRLEALWIFAGDDERRSVLGRALAERAEQEGWPLIRPPARAP